MFFADDIILIIEKKRVLNEKLEQWRDILEMQRLRVSHFKTEYLWCNFNNETEEEGDRN